LWPLGAHFHLGAALPTHYAAGGYHHAKYRKIKKNYGRAVLEVLLAQGNGGHEETWLTQMRRAA
jgi:hypothetical protein